MSGGAIVRTPREDLVYSLFVHSSSSLLLLLAMEFIESRVFAKSRVWLGLLSKMSIHIQLQVAGHSLCNFAQRTLISILTVIL